MTPDPSHDATTVRISRDAVRGSGHAQDRSVPLLRTESSNATEDHVVEVPIPLAKVSNQQEAHVLHVDDNPQIGQLVQTFLERIEDGFTVTTETSAVAALNRLEREGVDCIISDYQMPNMDGLEFLEVVRERYPDLPFILFTGRGSEEIASEAIAAGVTDYMQKGTSSDQYEVLANRAANAIEQHQTEQQFWNALSWYQRLVEQELAGVCIVQDERFVYVNQKLADIFGYRQDELVDQPVATIADPDTDDDLLDLLRRQDHAVNGSSQADFAGRTADGDRVTVELSGGAIEYDGADAWIGVLRDVDHED
jgi:PAS domain S-box-containing protein